MCAVAAGVVALAPLASAQDTTTMTTTSTTMTTAAPSLVSGTVLRYYTDDAGYVTAMDVQTANGVQMVTFAPGMGQRIYQAYPVGGTANVWVSGGMGGSYVVGMGTETPSYWMTPYRVRAQDLLDSVPYTYVGAKEVTVGGTLRRLVTNDAGEVVGLVIDATTMDTKHGLMSASSMSGTAGANPTSTSAMYGMGGGRMLIQVPREMRHIAPGDAGSERVTPLFRNARVWVTGWPVVSWYGALSPYASRLAATAIVVNGRSVGPIGFPLMSKEQTRSLFNNVDVMKTSMSKEEAAAGTMGYSVYDPTGSMTGTGMMGGTTTTTGTTSTTGTGTTP